GGGSIFVMGDHDPFVPSDCKAGLLRAIETHSSSAQVIRLNAGHFKTMVTSGRYQRCMLGIEHRKASRRRMPSLSLPQLSLPWSATEELASLSALSALRKLSVRPGSPRS